VEKVLIKEVPVEVIIEKYVEKIIIREVPIELEVESIVEIVFKEVLMEKIVEV
jgi:hypothetical protein